MPALGAGTSWQQILADAAAIGFAGIELGGSFPRDPAILGPALAAQGLAAIGQWYGCALLERSLADEIEAITPALDRLLALDAAVLVVAETSNAIHRERGQSLAQTPRLEADRWAAWGERLTGLAEHVATRGLRFAYHYHLGTIIERIEDVERLLGVTGPAVGLTIDSGHAAYGGIDPAALVRAAPERIAHVHLKDVRTPVFDALRAGNGSFLDGVLDGIFAAPGDGALDFAALMQALADSGFAGWAVIEAEQDPSRAEPVAHSAAGLAVAREAARNAGLKEIEH